MRADADGDVAKELQCVLSIVIDMFDDAQRVSISQRPNDIPYTPEERRLARFFHFRGVYIKICSLSFY